MELLTFNPIATILVIGGALAGGVWLVRDGLWAVRLWWTARGIPRRR